METKIKAIFKNEYKIRPTWDTDLTKYCKKLEKKYKYKYNGVYMRDQIKYIPKLNNSFSIINFDTSQNKGTHWVGIIQSYNYVYYFDSYGASPLQEVMNLFKPEFEILYINYAVQMQNTAICGLLVLVFFEYLLKLNSSRLNYYKLIKLLSKYSNRVKNDEK